MKTKQYSDKEVSALKLTDEIRLVFADLEYVNTWVDNNDIHHAFVSFEDDKNASEWLTVDSLHAVHEPFNIEDVKSDKNHQIDIRSKELIAEGFQYDSNTFSLSSEAQKNWIAYTDLIYINMKNASLYADPPITDINVLIATEKAVADSFFPLEVTLIDDTAYNFTSFTNYKDFFNIAFSTVSNHLSSGRSSTSSTASRKSSIALSTNGQTTLQKH